MGDETEAICITNLPEGICIISLNRKHRRNAVDPETASKLHKAFLSFEAAENLKVCVFHGQHGTFCAGADLYEVAKMPVAQETAVYIHDAKAPMGPSRMQVKKPVIAAVSGHAVAGGLELSLLADLRVVEEDAIFGVFCRRWGVPLIDGGTVRLQKVVGFGRAMDMILTGRPVSANEALQMGLANRVVSRGAAFGEALQIARQLLQFPQECMNVDRDSAYFAAYQSTSFEDAMRNEFVHGWPVVSKESLAGAARFSAGAGRHGTFSDRATAKL